MGKYFIALVLLLMVMAAIGLQGCAAGDKTSVKEDFVKDQAKTERPVQGPEPAVSQKGTGS